MQDIFHIKLSRRVRKNLKTLPLHIVTKLQIWINDVGERGLSEVRKTPGYHDEPLHGSRATQRSIRLNQSYRAIYVINKKQIISFIEVIEVTKHDY